MAQDSIAGGLVDRMDLRRLGAHQERFKGLRTEAAQSGEDFGSFGRNYEDRNQS